LARQVLVVVIYPPPSKFPQYAVRHSKWAVLDIMRVAHANKYKIFVQSNEMRIEFNAH
jgi:hypothetical protein